MTEKEFREGLAILQGACGRNYRETSFAVWWEALKDEFGGAYLSICRELAKTEEKLPALSVLMDRLRALRAEQTKEKTERADQDYYAQVITRANEYERVVGNSFENFLRLNGGDHTLAGYYFGRAYWNALGITKHDAVYDRLIEKRERFLANPEKAKEETVNLRKKEIAERIKIGEARDRAELSDERIKDIEKEVDFHLATIPEAAEAIGNTFPPENKEPEFTEENLPF